MLCNPNWWPCIIDKLIMEIVNKIDNTKHNEVIC